MPFDVAFALPFWEAFAWHVVHGEQLGGVKFDWDGMRWPAPKPPRSR